MAMTETWCNSDVSALQVPVIACMSAAVCSCLVAQHAHLQLCQPDKVLDFRFTMHAVAAMSINNTCTAHFVPMHFHSQRAKV